VRTLGGRLSRDRTVRVVVGEAGGTNRGPLRCALEREGLEVVGHAATEEELEGLLVAVQPTAIVLDANIAAMAVLTAREVAPAARIVVVWPAGVSGAIADECIEPSRVHPALGNAVRRAAHPELSPVMERTPVAVESEDREWRGDLSTGSERRSARRGRVIVLAAASFLLVGSVAFAFTRPYRADQSVQTHETSHRTSVAASSGRAHTNGTDGGVSADGSCAGPPSSTPNGTQPQGPTFQHGNDGNHVGSGGSPPSACNSHGNQGHRANPGHHGDPGRPGDPGHGDPSPPGQLGHSGQSGAHGSAGAHGEPPPRPTPSDHSPHP
jgi:hypothetical protein